MPEQPKSPRQFNRRLKYGSNVILTVAIIAALAVLVNWLGYRHYARHDFTANHLSSLSPQTYKVLDQLHGKYHVVTLLYRTVQADPRLNQISDLTDEYARYSDRISVEHIDPATDIARSDSFYQSLRQHYQKQLQPVVEAVDNGREVLSQVLKDLGKTVPRLQQLTQGPGLHSQPLKTFLENITAAARGNAARADSLDKQLRKDMDQPLPQYGRIMTEVESYLHSLDQGLLDPAAKIFKKQADNAALSPGVQNNLLKIAQRFEQIRKQAVDALTQLKQAPKASDYEQVSEQLANGAAALPGDVRGVVAIVGPKRVHIIRADSMFRTSVQDNGNDAERTASELSRRFAGEARITGTLLSMSIKQPPLVVFVNTGRRPALGRGGSYNIVAQRLRNANFDVDQWSPLGRTSPYTGQPRPAGQPPQAKPGQKTVWIIMPTGPSNPMTGGNGDQQIAALLDKHLARGDAALVLRTYNGMPGQFDPVTQYLTKTWGMTPRTDRIILHEDHADAHHTVARTFSVVRQWGSSSPVDKALAGLPALFQQSSPIEIASPESQGATTQPAAGNDSSAEVQRDVLIQVTGDRLWTLSHPSSYEQVHSTKYDPATAAPSFDIGIAAEGHGTRMILVTAPIWATDDILASQYSLMFPGNSELFVNSVYWLAGLDQMIAASPHLQKIRVVQPITQAGMTWYFWGLLAGLPVLVAFCGTGVWLVRRKG